MCGNGYMFFFLLSNIDRAMGAPMSDVTELMGRHAGYEVAEQCQGSTAEDVCRQKNVVVGGVEQSAADVRHGKAEKHDRAAVGGDDGG